MIVLALDTALDACSVAIVRGEQTLADLSERMQRGQAERLAPMVREAATQAGVAFPALDLVAVTTGPGSFTGVRIACGVAQGLALGAGRPLLGVSTLLTCFFPITEKSAREVRAQIDARKQAPGKGAAQAS